MKKRFEIYLDTEELQLIEQLKHDTGHKKPGMAIAAAIYSYFRYQDTIKRLIAENTQLKNKVDRALEKNFKATGISFKGHDSQAREWFEKQMRHLESEEFAESNPQVTVHSGTEATFGLIRETPDYGNDFEYEVTIPMSKSNNSGIKYEPVDRWTVRFKPFS